MDLFKEILPAIDKGDISWVYELSEQELKKISPYLLMKYMSGSKGQAEYHIVSVNKVVNRNFWALSKDYKDLQLLLLTVCGTDTPQYHYYPGKSKLDSKLYDFIRSIHPLWKADEIEMVLDLSTPEEMIDMAMASGMQDKELKLFKKDVKKHYG